MLYTYLYMLFSHISPPSPCAGQRVLQRPFHRSLSVAHSSLMFQAFRSLLTVSFHLNFGFSLGRFPSFFISTTAMVFSVSPLLLTCTNHSSLLLLITIAIGSTFASSVNPAFIYGTYPNMTCAPLPFVK